MKHFIIIGLSLLALTGCSESAVRYAAPPIESGTKVKISVARLEVTEVSLPAYAKSEEIWRETETGGLVSDASILWADDPSRSITLELSKHLSAITGARVAAEPWPFEEPAQSRLTVRVEELLASQAGIFKMSGTYYVSKNDDGRERSGSFQIDTPIAADGGASEIAAARAIAVRDLAQLIAKRGI